MEVLYSSETLVLTTAAWHNIQEDGILHILKMFVGEVSNFFV
jgi:hypothetical protein